MRDEDRNAVLTVLKVGGLQVRGGASAQAVGIYARVAKSYEDQGFAPKAIAVHKQILSIDPNQTDLFGKLAELYLSLIHT